MYKNKAENGLNNISGSNIKKIRQALPGKVSQRKLADMLQMEGLDLDKNAIQKIESGDRTGDFSIWDRLEDITGIHQRILRETSETHQGKAKSQ